MDDSAPTKKSDVVELFSCGDVKKNPEVVIRIVKDNETLEDDRVGEIFISSPSLAAGYYPSSTEAFSVSEEATYNVPEVKQGSVAAFGVVARGE